jgi:hypothetical protein
MALNTKLILTGSSVVLGPAGAACLFMPEELAASLGADGTSLPVLIQLLGALYLGFAMANWMVKGASIGGVYGRPISIANFTHFAIGALALAKHVRPHPSTWATAALIAYAVFAVLFAYVVFVASPGGKHE